MIHSLDCGLPRDAIFPAELVFFCASPVSFRRRSVDGNYRATGLKAHEMLCEWRFALLRPASAPLPAKIRTAYFGINTSGSNVNLMRP